MVVWFFVLNIHEPYFFGGIIVRPGLGNLYWIYI